MPINKLTYQSLILSINVGNSVAENDTILEQAMVKTPIFEDVLRGEHDVITGKKGAGKTAIFRLLTGPFRGNLLSEKNIALIDGVNSSGDSVFNRFKDQFKGFDERDFENFWKLYIISLIYNQFINNPTFDQVLSNLDDQVKKFKAECYAVGIPDVRADQTREQLMGWVLNSLRRVKRVAGHAGVSIETPSLFGVSGGIEFSEVSEVPSKEDEHAIYVSNIGSALQKLLADADIEIWVVLDRLDEVFDRYSPIEFNGLRGLLRTYKSFAVSHDSRLKIKIFLRDDIKDFLFDVGIFRRYNPKTEMPPLAAATHIFSRESPILNWTEAEIQQLILKRLIASTEIRKFLGIESELSYDEVDEMLRSRTVRLNCWNKIFPERIGPQDSLAWIYRRLQDAHGVITPRSVVDMLAATVDFEKSALRTDFEDREVVFSVDAMKQGITIASKNKLENDIYNEFPEEQANIKKLGVYGKHKLSSDDLKRIYGKDWASTANRLNQIGILKKLKTSNDYMVEFLFRPALDITYRY